MDNQQRSHIEKLLAEGKKPSLSIILLYMDNKLDELLPLIKGGDFDIYSSYKAQVAKARVFISESIEIRSHETSREMIVTGTDSRNSINQAIELITDLDARIDKADSHKRFGFLRLDLDIAKKMLEDARDYTELEINAIKHR